MATNACAHASVVNGHDASFAVERALEFLEKRQHVSGEFKMEFTLHEAVDPVTGIEEVREDESPFSSSFIVHSLSYSENEKAKQMIDRALVYLRSQELPGGLWRYWNKGTAPLGDIPTDVDDTSCVSFLLQSLGGERLDNRWLLLLNRDARGLFYTWIVPRKVSPFNFRYWRIILGDWTYERNVKFWTIAPAKPKDVDAVVNANVALYFGPVPEMNPVIEYLLEIVRDGRESDCDRYYPDANTFYYAISRCYATGHRKLDAARPALISRMQQRHHDDGRIGPNEMTTAIGAAALLNFNESGTMVDHAVDYILKTQQEDGGWASRMFYSNGSRPAQTSWASRELTTGFCVEVLERFISMNAKSD